MVKYLALWARSPVFSLIGAAAGALGAVSALYLSNVVLFTFCLMLTGINLMYAVGHVMAAQAQAPRGKA